MVSAFRRSLPHGAQSQTTLSQLQGVRSKAGAVKGRGLSPSKSTGCVSGDPGGEEDVDKERCFCTAMSSVRGALVHVRHSRRWRALSVGVGGGFIVQFCKTC